MSNEISVSGDDAPDMNEGSHDVADDLEESKFELKSLYNPFVFSLFSQRRFQFTRKRKFQLQRGV